MVLVLNAIVDAEARARFDRVTVPRFAALASQAVGITYLQGDDLSAKHEGATHLLISGSELSAAVGHERDEAVYALIRAFVDAGKPVLGICWGHQMLAKALAGPAVCRRAARPEFGWRKVRTRPNALFEGMTEVVSAHSHRDEVGDLPAPFEVIASTPDCEVQAFQYDRAPIWGVQFHPEIARDQGRAIFAKVARENPEIRDFLHDELEDGTALDENAQLFENFFGAGVGALEV